MEALALEQTATVGQMRLDRALARLQTVLPSAAGRAKAALAETLGGVRRSSWPEVAWRASSLTDDGFPVEFSWSSRGRAVRWTAEAVGPETPECDRLTEVLRRFEHLSGRSLEHALPANPGRRFGAWLGGRHDEFGEDTYKVYAEAEAPPAGAVTAFLVAEADLARRLRIRMVGAEAGGPLELYARAEKLDVLALRRFFGRDFDRVEPTLSALAGQRIPHTGGVSLALLNGETMARFWFAPSQLICGGAGRVAERLKAASVALGVDASIRRALEGRHGMIGVGVTAGGEVRLQVGVRPT